jgi:hypothetical protein
MCSILDKDEFYHINGRYLRSSIWIRVILYLSLFSSSHQSLKIYMMLKWWMRSQPSSLVIKISSIQTNKQKLEHYRFDSVLTLTGVCLCIIFFINGRYLRSSIWIRVILYLSLFSSSHQSLKIYMYMLNHVACTSWIITLK